MTFEPRDPNFKTRVRESFDRQSAMATLGGYIKSIEPGSVILGMSFDQKLTQQHGFLHAGIVTTMLDSAAGYAAFSLMDPEAAVLTIEFKTSLMAPASGIEFRFEGRVLKPGRTITFATAQAFAIGKSDDEKLIAEMTATMMAVTGRDEIKG